MVAFPSHLWLYLCKWNACKLPQNSSVCQQNFLRMRIEQVVQTYITEIKESCMSSCHILIELDFKEPNVCTQDWIMHTELHCIVNSKCWCSCWYYLFFPQVLEFVDSREHDQQDSTRRVSVTCKSQARAGSLNLGKESQWYREKLQSELRRGDCCVVCFCLSCFILSKYWNKSSFIVFMPHEAKCCALQLSYGVAFYSEV